jgi:hypothetical protein
MQCIKRTTWALAAVLLAATSPSIASAAERADPVSAARIEAVKKLEAALGTTASEAALKFKEEGREFEARVMAYGARWTAASSTTRDQLAAAFARDVFDSAPFQYNMKLSIIGGAVVVAGAATIYLGACVVAALGEAEVVGFFLGSGGLFVAGFTAAVDAGAYLLAAHVWKANPSVALFPNAADEVRERMSRGERVTFEEAAVALPETRSEDLSCPCFAGVEAR